MLNVAVPYEVPTIHSERFNYPPSPRVSPARHSLTPPGSTEIPRSRRGSAIAAEDEHCVTLADPIEDAPPVIVFFSFLDDHSKKWAIEHQVAHNIRRNVPQGTTVARYHAPMRFAWDFGETLTHAWAAAQSLQVDDRVIGPLFEAIHSKRVHDLEGVRVVFDEAGIDPSTFLKAWGQQTTLIEKERMDNAVSHLDLQTVPGILVNGKHMVKLDTHEEFSIDKAVELVRRLLKRE